MIHPKISQQSHLLTRTMMILQAELNNVNSVRKTSNDWMEIWRTLVAQAKVLQSWGVRLHPIYEEILRIHFSTPVSLVGDFIRDSNVSTSSIPSTIYLKNLSENCKDMLDNVLGNVFPVQASLMEEIQNDIVEQVSVGDNEDEDDVKIVYELINL